MLKGKQLEHLQGVDKEICAVGCRHGHQIGLDAWSKPKIRLCPNGCDNKDKIGCNGNPVCSDCFSYSKFKYKREND